MTVRDIICVDIETTGLHLDAAVLEVAAVNLTTGDEWHFFPYVDPAKFQHLQPQAMQINRYFERGAWKEMLSPSATELEYLYLRDMVLKGNAFAGANPAFDAARLPVSPVWHHRLLDLSAYAAGVLGIPPDELPGLESVCRRLGVVNDNAHTAISDVRATAECFRRLMERRDGSVLVRCTPAPGDGRHMKEPCG